MNNDLISRSELKKALCEFMKNNIGIYSNEMFHIVDSMPTVEQPQGGEGMTDTEKKELEELKERVNALEDQMQILHAEYKKLSGFNSLNQKYR